MSIKRIVESKQVEHVRNEKSILSKTRHPFLVRLFWTTHSNTLLYLPGGELFQLMRKREKLDAKVAVFYASEVLLALDYLHRLDILYRDLKPVSIDCQRTQRTALVALGKYPSGSRRTHSHRGFRICQGDERTHFHSLWHSRLSRTRFDKRRNSMCFFLQCCLLSRM